LVRKLIQREYEEDEILKCLNRMLTWTQFFRVEKDGSTDNKM